MPNSPEQRSSGKQPDTSAGGQNTTAKTGREADGSRTYTRVGRLTRQEGTKQAMEALNLANTYGTDKWEDASRNASEGVLGLAMAYLKKKY